MRGKPRLGIRRTRRFDRIRLESNPVPPVWETRCSNPLSTPAGFPSRRRFAAKRGFSGTSSRMTRTDVALWRASSSSSSSSTWSRASTVNRPPHPPQKGHVAATSPFNRIRSRFSDSHRTVTAATALARLGIGQISHSQCRFTQQINIRSHDSPHLTPFFFSKTKQKNKKKIPTHIFDLIHIRGAVGSDTAPQTLPPKRAPINDRDG